MFSINVIGNRKAKQRCYVWQRCYGDLSFFAFALQIQGCSRGDMVSYHFRKNLAQNLQQQKCWTAHASERGLRFACQMV